MVSVNNLMYIHFLIYIFVAHFDFLTYLHISLHYHFPWLHDILLYEHTTDYLMNSLLLDI